MSESLPITIPTFGIILSFSHLQNTGTWKYKV